ncbi:MAG: FMN-binding protein [Gammaproteobacteria bacterium]|nr:FMN-binding protein [Gammaproteobacteria bacterium]
MNTGIRIILDSVSRRACPAAGRWPRALAALPLVVAALLIAHPRPAGAESDEYQSPEDFVRTAFPDADPAARALWLRAGLRDDAAELLGRAPAPRIRYWQAGSRTAWILDEIGKDRPITAGVVVDGGAIADVRVLVFRESRGWEVKHAFFTDQFHDARLTADHDLDQAIDGITGATLSVRAMKKMARLALLLDAHAQGRSADLATRSP